MVQWYYYRYVNNGVFFGFFWWFSLYCYQNLRFLNISVSRGCWTFALGIFGTSAFPKRVPKQNGVQNGFSHIGKVLQNNEVEKQRIEE